MIHIEVLWCLRKLAAVCLKPDRCQLVLERSEPVNIARTPNIDERKHELPSFLRDLEAVGPPRQAMGPPRLGAGVGVGMFEGCWGFPYVEMPVSNCTCLFYSISYVQFIFILVAC